MNIKKICSFLIAVFYCILLGNFYNEADLAMLYNGVDSKNNMMLLTTHFLGFTSITFYTFGEFEKYLNGYGKYVLLRRKKRLSILNKIYIETFLAVIIFEIIKIIIFGIVSGVDKTNCKNFISMLILSTMTNLFLISLQIFIELKFNSKIALTTAMMYFIISCTAGGVFIKENSYKPLLFLIPNYSMNNRIEYFIYNLNLNYKILTGILLVGTICWVVSGKFILKRKDIF